MSAFKHAWMSGLMMGWLVVLLGVPSSRADEQTPLLPLNKVMQALSKDGEVVVELDPRALDVLLARHKPVLKWLLMPDRPEQWLPGQQMPLVSQKVRSHWLYDYMDYVPLAAGISFQLFQDWRGDLCSTPLLHSLITGLGSNWLYLHRSMPVWQRILERAEPDGVLDTLLPLITYGYAGFEIYDSVTKGTFEYLLHGGSIFLIMNTLHREGLAHLATDGLLVEFSTIFLQLRAVNQNFLYAFAATFYLYRWYVFPKMWLGYLKAVYWDGERHEETESIVPTITAVTTIFNALNLYWGILIARKLARHMGY